MELYTIAGPNGAGKTTFAQEFLPNYADCKNFVNADLIAQGMAPFSPETAAPASVTRTRAPGPRPNQFRRLSWPPLLPP